MLASDIDPWIWRGLAFLFGAVWGSFFNVAIYRWPRDMSVVTPASHCPACEKPIPFHRNLPIAGWVALRGRAECCGAKISARYPLVELASALLCVALAERYLVGAAPDATLSGAGIETLLWFAFVGGLVIASFVDLEHMEIPDEVSLPIGALGLVSVGLREMPGALDAAIGAGGAYLGVQLVFVWGYERIAGRRGMGEGDSKLLAMIGAFLGWQGALVALVLGAFQGLAVAIVMIALGKKVTPEVGRKGGGGAESEAESGTGTGTGTGTDTESGTDAETPIGHIKVPYGPFLALGALEFLFFGNLLLERYLSLFE